MAITVAGVKTELREVVLKAKPEEFLEVSPSKTVPTLVFDDTVIDESFDIMCWALKKNDPQNWLKMPKSGYELIEEIDGPFKSFLDKTKYSNKYPTEDPKENRNKASNYLIWMDDKLHCGFLFGRQQCLADIAIFPFVRQFAFIDKVWFDEQPWESLKRWLNFFIEWDLFKCVMKKYPPWKLDDTTTFFP